MGAGTLLIFIALLLVAIIAAGVILITSDSLQDQSTSTGKEAQSEVVTNVRVVEVSGSDCSDGRLDEMHTIYSLAPGSDPIKLENVLYSESTRFSSAKMMMRENALPIRDVFAGFFTASGYAYDSKTVSFSNSPPAVFVNRFPSPYTSAMMIGKIAIAIVFIESNGSTDANIENWTAQEVADFTNATKDAINWWSEVEPRAGIRHTFETYNVETSYEPITRAVTDEELWINETLDQIGAPAGATMFSRIRQFNQELRKRTKAHWAFVLFAVDSSEDADGSFPSGLGGIAYINGPHTFVANDACHQCTEIIIAHEVGHIFGARDEYNTSGCRCTDVGGFFSIETGNCDSNCYSNISSIMGENYIKAYQDHAVDLFALGQMGLIDSNSNNLLDPIDILFESDSEGASLKNNTIRNLAFFGYDNPSHTNQLGFFVVDYLKSGALHSDGNLQTGDVISIMHETAMPIAEDEVVRISFIPKVGSVKLTQFKTPQVMSEERVYLYPTK